MPFGLSGSEKIGSSPIAIRSPLSTRSSHRRKSVWIPYTKPRDHIAARPGDRQCCRRRYSSDCRDRRIICRLTDWRRYIRHRKRYGQRSALQLPRSGELACRSLTQRSDSCVGTNQPSRAQRGDPAACGQWRRVASYTLYGVRARCGRNVRTPHHTVGWDAGRIAAVHIIKSRTRNCIPAWRASLIPRRGGTDNENRLCGFAGVDTH